MFSKLIRYCTFRDNFFTLSFDYKGAYNSTASTYLKTT